MTRTIDNHRQTIDRHLADRPDYAGMNPEQQMRYRILVADTITELLSEIRKNRITVLESRLELKIVAMEVAEMGYRYCSTSQKLVRSELWELSTITPPVFSN